MLSEKTSKNLDIQISRVRISQVPGENLKLDGEATTLYLARILEISLNNATITSYCKKSHIDSYLERE